MKESVLRGRLVCQGFFRNMSSWIWVVVVRGALGSRYANAQTLGRTSDRQVARRLAGRASRVALHAHQTSTELIRTDRSGPDGRFRPGGYATGPGLQLRAELSGSHDGATDPDLGGDETLSLSALVMAVGGVRRGRVSGCHNTNSPYAPSFRAWLTIPSTKNRSDIAN